MLSCVSWFPIRKYYGCPSVTSVFKPFASPLLSSRYCNFMTRTIRAELLSEREYDAIIIGTGLTESILAAALASSGSSVLHIDANHFYGATW